MLLSLRFSVVFHIYDTAFLRTSQHKKALFYKKMEAIIMYAKLKRLVEANHISFYRLSKATGISQGNFGDWKNGRSKPSASALKKLSDYFGLPVSYFYDEAEPNTDKNTDTNTETHTHLSTSSYIKFKNFRSSEYTAEDEQKDDEYIEDFFTKFDDLNDLGRERLMEQLNFLLTQEKYKKHFQYIQSSSGGIALGA